MDKETYDALRHVLEAATETYQYEFWPGDAEVNDDLAIVWKWFDSQTPATGRDKANDACLALVEAVEHDLGWEGVAAAYSMACDALGHEPKES